ncbi:Uma2 family endonuclease [Dendronalium sp. ChiSLP03b]|uniref:Uma2 family endonuclease n=1 Tax=Dendronalium sp. ChiSLP03b TaxID=3075381 RepID=UPI002AD3736D|nr:Uma2 family endonuclease [Dendronalium sp. ChiSLP03b]MDZ8207067.1 Uma2 family endonuclease [Dendronalium sp. ChiSLP03b]
MTLSPHSSYNLSFEEFFKLPETKPASEYIDGKVYQKPMPQGKHSRIRTELSSAINSLSEYQHKALALTELRCTFDVSSLVPDIAVFDWSRLPIDDNGEIANRFEIYPDWIIEILSPDQFTNRVINKIIFCINQGTKLGWLIDPDDKSVMVFQPNQLPEVKYARDKLPVLDVLADWQVSPANIFNWLIVKKSSD